MSVNGTKLQCIIERAWATELFYFKGFSYYLEFIKVMDSQKINIIKKGLCIFQFVVYFLCTVYTCKWLGSSTGFIKHDQRRLYFQIVCIYIVFVN